MSSWYPLALSLTLTVAVRPAGMEKLRPPRVTLTNARREPTRRPFTVAESASVPWQRASTPQRSLTGATRFFVTVSERETTASLASVTGVTVRETAATFESADPSLALKLNESGPL